jgi:hypothetical protein
MVFLWIFLTCLVSCSNPFVKTSNAVDTWKNYAEFKLLLYTKVLWDRKDYQSTYKIKLLPDYQIDKMDTLENNLKDLENKVKQDITSKSSLSIVSKNNPKFYDVSKLVQANPTGDKDYDSLISEANKENVDSSYRYFLFLKMVKKIHEKSSYDATEKQELEKYTRDVSMGRILTYVISKGRDVRISNLDIKDFSGNQFKLISNTQEVSEIYINGVKGEFKIDFDSFSLVEENGFKLTDQDIDDIGKLFKTIKTYRSIPFGTLYEKSKGLQLTSSNRALQKVINDDGNIPKEQKVFYKGLLQTTIGMLNRGEFESTKDWTTKWMLIIISITKPLQKVKVYYIQRMLMVIRYITKTIKMLLFREKI